MQINHNYQILNGNGNFVDFHGINEQIKDSYLKIKLENGQEIICSEDHIFIVGNKNISANSLEASIGYLSTISGDSIINSIEKFNEEIILYDIIESNEGYQYLTNNIISHNCSFLGSGDNFISEEYLRRIDEYEIENPLREEGGDKQFWIYEDPEPTATYIMSIDASAGHGDDNSTINMLKIEEYIEEKEIIKDGKTKTHKFRKNKIIQVAEYYGKLKPKELAEIAYVYGITYNNAYCIVDVTGGYGVNTIERLIEMGYENIHYSEITHKSTRDRLDGYIKKGKRTMPDGRVIDVDLIPGFFIGSNRGSILIEMQRAINLEDCVIRSLRLLNELKTFVTVTGSRVADHKRSFHDDSIMGLACGIYVANFEFKKYTGNPDRDKKILNAMLSVMNNTKSISNEKLIENNNKKNKTTRTPEYRVTRNNPYGSNSWLFKNLK